VHARGAARAVLMTPRMSTSKPVVGAFVATIVLFACGGRTVGQTPEACHRLCDRWPAGVVGVTQDVCRNRCHAVCDIEVCRRTSAGDIDFDEVTGIACDAAYGNVVTFHVPNGAFACSPDYVER
jgi:hypothetical protein